VIVLVSKKKEFVYLVQSVPNQNKFNFLQNYFAEQTFLPNKVDSFIKENKFFVSICLGLFIVGLFLIRSGF
jgi:hypothetical protein